MTRKGQVAVRRVEEPFPVPALPLTHSPKEVVSGADQRGGPTARLLGVKGRMAVGCNRIGPIPNHSDDIKQQLQGEALRDATPGL